MEGMKIEGSRKEEREGVNRWGASGRESSKVLVLVVSVSC